MNYTYKDEYFKSNYLKSFKIINRKLKKIESDYKHAETKTTSSPAAPNSSTFRATHGGHISAYPVSSNSCINRGGEIFSMNVGSNVNPAIKQKIQKRTERLFKREGQKMGESFGVSHSYGTNYSPTSVYWTKNGDRYGLTRA